MPERVHLSPEDWVLLIVGLAGGELRGATTLQKLGFLGVMEAGGQGLIYVPWKYGPYSEDLKDAVRTLRREGLLEQRVRFEDRILYRATVYYYQLTPDGEERYRQLLSQLEKKHPRFVRKMKEIVAKWKGQPLRLLYYVYKRYPDWTRFSVIRDQVLALGEILDDNE